MASAAICKGLYITTNSPSCLARVEWGCVPFTISEKLKMAGVKSVGPARPRVNGSVTVCEGGFPPLLSQALYSCPRTPSCVIRLGQVRWIPVGMAGS